MLIMSSATKIYLKNKFLDSFYYQNPDSNELNFLKAININKIFRFF